MHKGTKLVGHVTEAQAKAKKTPNPKVGVVFDRAVLKGGQEVSFSGVIQALAPPVQGTLAATGDAEWQSGIGNGSGGGSSMGGGRSGGGWLPSAELQALRTQLSVHHKRCGNTAGSVTNSATGAVNGSVSQTTGAAANGTFNSATRGVVGMQGLALNTAARATRKAP